MISHMLKNKEYYLVYTPPVRVSDVESASSSNPRLQPPQLDENVQYSADRIFRKRNKQESSKKANAGDADDIPDTSDIGGIDSCTFSLFQTIMKMTATS